MRINDLGQPIGDPVAWSGAQHPDGVVLEGRFVRLVPLAAEHAPALLDLGRQRELWTYLGDDAPTTLDEALAATGPREGWITYAIVERTTGRFLGRAGYLRIQPRVGSIEVGGIVYHPDLQRTRASTEVQYLLARHVFEDLGYRRYEWRCDDLNAPSRRTAERLGFVDEGTFRNGLVNKGHSRDTVWFSITDREWPRIAAALQAWLDDANVDAHGRQRHTLAELRAAGSRVDAGVGEPATPAPTALRQSTRVIETNVLGQPVGPSVDWHGARTPSGEPIHGRCVRLEPLRSDHAPGLLALGCEEALWTYLGDEPPADLAAATALTQPQPGAIAYAIVDAASAEFLGRVSYLRIQPELGSIEVGYVLYSPRLQRTRAATEVQYLLARHAFDLGYRRYEWKCDSLNAPSRRAAERLGFVEECTMRQALVTKGRNRDTTWFSITDTEWPRVARAMEAWLADANINADGGQVRSLAELRGELG